MANYHQNPYSYLVVLLTLRTWQLGTGGAMEMGIASGPTETTSQLIYATVVARGIARGDRFAMVRMTPTLVIFSTMRMG